MLPNPSPFHSPLTTQADAVIYFLQQLDIDTMQQLLDENRTYQDFSKADFIEKLGKAMEEFLQGGDKFLYYNPGCSTSKECNYKSKGFSFVVNKSGHYLDMIIDIKDGVVQDMYECSEFDEEAPRKKNNRIRINKIVIQPGEW